MEDMFDVFETEGKAPAPKPAPGDSQKRKKEPTAGASARAQPAAAAAYAGKPSATEILAAEQLQDVEDAKLKKARKENPEKLELVPLRGESTTISKEFAECVHEVAIPTGFNYIPFSEQESQTKPPAKTYPFTLDPFQKQAIKCLERGESVLVSAHTSAGKTVVAEYAIAMSLRDKQRVIYTSPIKALSNQKYRQLQEEFKDVGLMTGDVTINPAASCLVMTTEILRSMLYRGSEIMREVGWVVFDEIHYMRDKERGVVWEETIILLPHKVHHVFLSATIPNAIQFARWVGELHQQPCHVVYTDYRPVPLQHYMFPAGGDGLHLVVDERGEFREDHFARAMASLSENSNQAQHNAKKGKRGGTKGPSDCFRIVKMIMERSYQPVIVFSFSKRECEAYALQMSKLDFNTDEEKKMVQEVFSNAIDILSDDDKKLPQVEHVLPLLKRGIGIHHSGLLPILKEVIEILFQEGLVKALFATETFSMGLNMPARTCVFTNVRKFDGKDFRWVTGGEYIQMSGRAGRRGLDDRGIVILMVDEKMEPTIAKGLLKGQADTLNSAFHLTYNMVLNLLRVEGINPEFMIERSFFQFQQQSAIPQIEEKLSKLTASCAEIVIRDEESTREFYDMRLLLGNLSKEMQATITEPEYALPFLNVGRLVHVVDGVLDYGWGAIVNFQKRTPPQGGKQPSAAPTVYVVEVVINCSASSKSKPMPCSPGEKGEVLVIPVLLPLVARFSSIRICLPTDIRPPDARTSVLKTINEVLRRFPDGLPPLDPIEDMKIKSKDFERCVRKVESLEQRLHSHALSRDPMCDALMLLCAQKETMEAEIKAVKKMLKDSKSVLQLDELKARKRVLRRLQFCSSEDVIETKGRVACEISTGDELLLTEMVFDGVFNDLSVEQTVALLSCFVMGDKSESSQVKDDLAGPYRALQECARKVAKVCKESKMPLEEDEYVQSFRPDLMEVVRAWSSGSKFIDVCKLTDIFEGSIIRAVRRLEELLRQMCSAAKSIGNVELEKKFAEGITRIKRDIIFAASLYL